MKHVHALINITEWEERSLTKLGRKILDFHRRTRQPASARYIVVAEDSGRGPGGSVGPPLLVVWLLKGDDVLDIAEDLQ